jgi:H+-transporting ATPase
MTTHETARENSAMDDRAGGVPPGLTSADALRRLGEVGPNAVPEPVDPAWRRFLAKFWAPIPWMLEAAIVLQIGLHAYVEAAVIGGLLLFNAALGYAQEGRATAALAALKQRLAATALVLRDGQWIRRPAPEVVPGDVVRIALGAAVPADLRLASGSVLVDQSTLTGESMPVEAGVGGQVYAGSTVSRGQAIGVVTATGASTQFGRTAELVQTAHAASTEQKAILGVARSLALINGAVAAAIVIYAWRVGLSPAEIMRFALTALLATIPAALPATFTLSAAMAAQVLARRGVLLTRLSAAHEAASMDVLCADKTGTLTRNALEVAEVRPLPGHDANQVLALAALASSEADQDPIDAAIRRAATRSTAPGQLDKVLRFTPFDPTTRVAEALVRDAAGEEIRVVKGAFEVVTLQAEAPAEAAGVVEALAARGQRVIAVAAGPKGAIRLLGLVALSDPPREDSAGLIADLSRLGVRTVMVTGDSPITAAAIAAKVGVTGAAAATPAGLSEGVDIETIGVFARVLPAEKHRLVQLFQARGHAVGMCGDGVNDAPALRQAQIGIAVSTATDVAKAAAGMVLTEPGLAGVVDAVREGRAGFQRLLAYALNMVVKKVEILLFLAFGLVLTGQAILTPALMVLMLMTNDFLAMSLTTDRTRPAESPSRWRTSGLVASAAVLGICKLVFSAGVLAFGYYELKLAPGPLRTLAFAALIFGSQGLLYVVRERRRIWSSAPSLWVVLASVIDIAIVFGVALSGVLTPPLPWPVLAATLVGAAVFALLLDQIKRPVLAAFRIG